ncbi:two-component sensor histidine kinase [Sphingomonas sp. UYAg733]
MREVQDGLLLSEHAHRVANDMAVAAAALRLALRRTDGDPDIAAAAARIGASAQVQRILCARPVGATVELGCLLKRLCAAMALAHPGPIGAVEVIAAPLHVTDGAAMPLAMCVHELVRNALVHAGRGGGHVRVEVSDDGVTTTVAVCDRGPARVWERSGGQGAAIVDQLAARLRGSVSRQASATGGKVVIAMPSIVAGIVPALAEA